MTSPIRIQRSFGHALLMVSMLAGGEVLAQDRATDLALTDALRDLHPLAHSGVLLDRVLPLAHIEAEVRRLLGEAVPVGAHSVRRDRRNAGGGTAPPGLYFVRCVAGSQATGRRLEKLD